MRQADTKPKHENVLLYYLQRGTEEKLELIKEFILSRMETTELLVYLGFDFMPMRSNTISKGIVDLCVENFLNNSKLKRDLATDCLLALFLKALLYAIPDQALSYFPHNLTAADASTLTTAFTSKPVDEKRRLTCLGIAYLCTLSRAELGYIDVNGLPELKPSLELFRQSKSQSLFALLREVIAPPVPLGQSMMDKALADYYTTAIRCGHVESVIALGQLLKRLLLKKSSDGHEVIAEFGHKLACIYQNSLEDTRDNKYVALFWYLQAAEKGNLVAKECLENMARDDAGCGFKLAQWLEYGSDFFPQGESRACNYYFIAAKRGREEALSALVRLLIKRNNTTLRQHSEKGMSEVERVKLYKHLKNFAKGHEGVLGYFEDTARNNPQYAFEIGQWFERRGDIFLKNKYRACDYYFMAAKQGDEESLVALIRLLDKKNNAALNIFTLFKQKTAVSHNNNEVSEHNRMSALSR